MATQQPFDSQPPVASPLLPPYPELIFSAIEAIDDKNGANKSTIAKHIEGIYGSLPAAHTTVLFHHLNKMKAAGDLIIVKNNYLRPDPNAPVRRGRGRPPKPKLDPSPDAVVSPSRPRGRPAKPRDPLAPVPSPKKAAPSASGRKRGRPAKLGKLTPAVSSPVNGERRGRGRPPKVKTPVAAPVGA